MVQNTKIALGQCHELELVHGKIKYFIFTSTGNVHLCPEGHYSWYFKSFLVFLSLHQSCTSGKECKRQVITKNRKKRQAIELLLEKQLGKM